MIATHSEKNKDIEVLRAFAVGGVLAHHATGVLLPPLRGELAWIPETFNFGAGVDLFFVISGFVIARSLLPRLRNAGSAAQTVKETLAFWTRRAFRLLPTAWLWLALILAVTSSFAFNNPKLAFETNVDATVAGVFYFANVRFAETFGASPYGASFHYWTLSLEEQFYFLLPLIALLSGRRLGWALLALIAIDLLRPPSLLAVSTRASALLIGVLIAMWSEQKSYARLAAMTPRWLALPVSVAALLAIPYLSAAIGPFYQAQYGLVSLVAGVSVLAASFNKDALCGWGPWRGFALWAGARSYALYVIHVPLFLVIQDVLRRTWHPPWSPELCAIVLISAGLLLALIAELNYRIVESPLRRLGARIADGIAGRGEPGQREAAA